MPDPDIVFEGDHGEARMDSLDTDLVILDESNALRLSPEEERERAEERLKRRLERHGRTPPPEPPAERR